MTFDISFNDTQEKMQVESVRMSDDSKDQLDITAPGNKSPVIVYSQFFISSITISGFSIATVPPKILAKMRKRQTIAVTIRSPAAETYEGTIGIKQFAQGDGKGNPTTSITGTFAGKKSQADEKAQQANRYGTVIDLHDGTSFTLNCQDISQSVAYRPFFKDGVADNELAVSEAVKAVILSQKQGDVSEYQHTHPGDDSLMILSATGKRWDSTSVGGMLIYGNGPRSCTASAPTVTVGYAEDKREVTVTCDGASLTKSVKTQVPVLSIRIPCVWPGPDPPSQPDSLGLINSADFPMFGEVFEALSMRSDGFDYRPIEAPDGIYYSGSIRYLYKKDGWKVGTVTCIRYEALPLEGDQTLPSYQLVGEHENIYIYDDGDFESIETLCPTCYG